MILINSTPYCDHDMPDKNLHLSVGGMTCDKVWVSSAGPDRQLEDPWKDHGDLSSVMMAESIDNLELELANQNCFGTTGVVICKHAGYAQDKTLINIRTSPTSTWLHS